MRLALPLLVACSAGPFEPEATAPTTTFGSATGSTTFVEPPAPFMELGDGQDGHEPCEPGQQTPITFGPAGGFYLHVSAQVWHLGDKLWVNANARRLSDGALLGESGDTALILADYDLYRDTGWYADQRVFLPPDPDFTCALDGEPIEVCAWAEPIEGGGYAEACMELVTVMAEPDPCSW